ncbi:hypothetical protein BGZ58_006861 [Dissophora ornata]|nr:hypothetical protein BGZ58_006861 [Dissophora ornata]
MSWIQLASANIAFTSLQDNLSLKPGASVVLTWRTVTANGTSDLADFTLVLRALSGQKYTIQSDVPQAQFTLTVQIPSTATGGMHSFYAYYTGSLKGSSTSTNQFSITGAVVTTPATGTATTTSTTTSTPATKTPTTVDNGISGAAIAGIIAAVVVLLLVTALVFFNRHRRRIAVAQSRGRAMDDNKEAGFTSGPGAYGSKNQDKVSLTKSAGSGGGPVDGGMVAAPLRSPGIRPPRPDESPRSQRQQPNSPTRNPFDNPEAVIPSSGMSPRQNQYQPPQLPNPLQSPFNMPSQPYGMSSPPVGPPASYQQQQLQRNAAGPYQQNERNSFESDAESAYDPVNSRMMAGGSPSTNMRSSPMNGSPLAHSPSTNSSRYPRNMAPQPQAQHQNPFMNDHELMAVAAAAAAAAASPAQAHRQLQQPSGQPTHDPRTMSPSAKSASPKIKEIEMQPLDIQQHHLDQQQKLVQRQQQQQQYPMPAAQNSINPTQFDDKAEFDEDDNVTVYNGYRDTIFGAYSQGDDEDEGEGVMEPVPAVPTLASNISRESAMGGAEIQRKKSIKFTGVPPTGPIVLPNHEAAKEHQAQRQQRQQQRQEQEQMRPASEVEYTEDDEDGEYPDEDEDDIKMRLMMTEALSPVSSSSSRPYDNIGANTSSPPLPQQRPYNPPTAAETSASLDGGSPFGGDFFEDVLAAVEKNSAIPSPTSTSPPKSSQTASGYSKPAMPPIPRSPPTKQATPQQSVQQQYIPAPQPQHFQPVNEQVFGAPSPRIAPAVAPINNTN